MDYCQLLFKAQENKLNAKSKEVRCYNTTFGAPKKLEKRVSTENIKKFLARKEEEEKQKVLEAKRKKDELLALRSQDRKAQKRVQVMLKRTKSANKSVMEDAIDNVNTADTLAGPAQCDEDDYGYVSQEASAYYNKLMDKYQNMPPDQIFSSRKSEVKDLNAAKDRVKAALLKEAEEELLPHKRKRKKKINEDLNSEEVNDKTEEDKEEKDTVIEEHSKPPETLKKERKSVAPPLDFSQLLKIAEKKQHEPIIIEKVEQTKETERLMTKREKMEYLREKERRAQKGLGLPEGKLYAETKKADYPIKTKSDHNNIVKKGFIEKKKREIADPINNTSQKSKMKPVQHENTEIKNSPSVQMQGKVKLPVEHKLQKNSQVWSKSCNLSNKLESLESKKVCNKKVVSVNEWPNESSSKISNETNIKHPIKETQEKKNPAPKKAVLEDSNHLDELSEIDREIELLRRKRELLANRAKPVVGKLEDGKSKPKEQVSAPVTNKQKPVILRQDSSKNQLQSKNLKSKQTHDLKKAKIKKRRIDSDSEYDSEMDDFIDDEPTEDTDVSKHIYDIFGYDKSRYKDVDDEDECMESNFAQQMKEEFVSTKIGIMEDLEDIRQEQLEKARKKKKKEMTITSKR